ncbi:MAG TPA: SDR family oxidoreductase [Bryobacteraceae bacterium]|nr:SDR family oxidoreductase [Bryobacteraceae bacterium]
MKIRDKIVVVTGGAHGIGKALCERFAAEGAKEVVVADIDEKGAAAVASGIHGSHFCVNVEAESEVQAMVDSVVVKHGRIDLFCANAGIGVDGGCDVPTRDWQRIWEINVMAHVYSSRAVLPGMLARKEGYLLHTASAAGLLTQIGSAPYSVTKHAVVALAEWLSITYGDHGIKVSVLCPQGVKTSMLERAQRHGAGNFLLAGALEPEQVADTVVKGIDAEHFLILPHPEVKEYLHRKATDYDRWIRGMRRLQAQLMEKTAK